MNDIDPSEFALYDQIAIKWDSNPDCSTASASEMKLPSISYKATIVIIAW